MEITFKTKKLEKECNQYQEARKAYGEEQGRKIIKRIIELRAFDSLAQIPSYPPMRGHSLSGKRQRQFAITVKEPYRLIIEPDQSPLPRNDDGGIDKNEISCIKIMGVENYHD